MSEIEDLLASDPPRKKRGRPTNAERDARLATMAADADMGRIELPSSSLFYRPVGVKFLSEVFRMEQRTVNKKLMKCPIVELADERGRTVPKWDFKVAAGFLIEPKINLIDYLTSLNSNNIPPHLNKMFWDAQNARAKWEANARHTWHDADVLKVLGDTAIHIRETTLLWIENLPGRTKISTEDYDALRVQVDGLLEEIKTRLIEQPALRRTQSVVQRMDDLIQVETDQTIHEAYDDDLDELLT